MKTAIITCADTGPLESLVYMLNHAGYRCHTLGDDIKHELRRIGCDTILDIKGLVDNWGYDNPFQLPTASIKDLLTCDLFIDLKAHRNGPKIWGRFPHLEKRTLWYRINGGEPEHVVNDRGDHGDEVNPPCPVITPNQWYKGKDWAYAMWPPFYRLNDYLGKRSRSPKYTNPMCLIHNLVGWGYGKLVDPLRKLGIKMYGVSSPDGLIPHSEIPERLSATLAMVHLKSSDAPGYALYEALAAGCPVICTRRIIWRCRMEDLLIPDETCLVFDRIGHQELTDEDVEHCVSEVSKHLQKLQTIGYNRSIGMAGYHKLKEVMWHPDRDLDSLKKFLGDNFDDV